MTNKQELFILEYLKDFNATQAAIRAGYSVDSARSIASELLTNPNIKREVASKFEEITGGQYKAILDNLKFWEEMRDNPEASETARIRASENHAKYWQMFEEKISVKLEQGDKPLRFEIVDKAE